VVGRVIEKNINIEQTSNHIVSLILQLKSFIHNIHKQRVQPIQGILNTSLLFVTFSYCEITKANGIEKEYIALGGGSCN